MSWITINQNEVNTFKDLLEINAQFFIPTYQRNYVWKSKYIRHFLNTIDNLLLEKDDFNYFGNITIVDRNKINYLEIIDGQQRITTFLLLMFSILYNYKIIVNEYKKESSEEKTIIFQEEENKVNELIRKYDNIFNNFIYTNKIENDIKIFYYEDFFENKKNNNRNKILKTLLKNINAKHESFITIDEAILDINSDINIIWNQKDNYILNFKHFNAYIKEKLLKKYSFSDRVYFLESILNIVYDFKIGIIKINNDKYVNKYFEQINTYKEKLQESDLIKNLLFSDYYLLKTGEEKKKFDNEWVKIFNLLINNKSEKLRFNIGNYFFYYCFVTSKKDVTKNNIFEIIRKQFVESENKLLEFNKINKKMTKLIGIFKNFYDLSENYDLAAIEKEKIITATILEKIWNTKKYDNKLINIVFSYLNAFCNKIINTNELLKFLEITILLVYKRFFFNDGRGQSNWEITKIRISKNLAIGNKNKAIYILRNFYMSEENNISMEKIINKNEINGEKWIFLWILLYINQQLKKLKHNHIDENTFKINLFSKKNINFIFPLKPTKRQKIEFPEITRLEKNTTIANIILSKDNNSILVNNSTKFNTRIYDDLIVRSLLYIPINFNKEIFNYAFLQEREVNIAQDIINIFKKMKQPFIS